MSFARGGSRPIDSSGGGESRNAVARSPVSSRSSALTPSASARSWIGALSSKSSPARVRRTVLAVSAEPCSSVIATTSSRSGANRSWSRHSAASFSTLSHSDPATTDAPGSPSTATIRLPEPGHLAADQQLLLLSAFELHHHAAARRVEPHFRGVVVVELAHRLELGQGAHQRVDLPVVGGKVDRLSQAPPVLVVAARSRSGRRGGALSPSSASALSSASCVRTSSTVRSPAWSSSLATSSRSTPSTRLASFSRCFAAGLLALVEPDERAEAGHQREQDEQRARLHRADP